MIKDMREKKFRGGAYGVFLPISEYLSGFPKIYNQLAQKHR
jgi:hypothetical protein